MLRAMGALAHLETRSLAVTPGGEAVAVVRVRNTGTVVDQFTVDVLGDAQPWSTAEPAVLPLFPGAEEQVRVTFRPPRSAQVPAGQVPFGVRVQSKEDPQGSVVEEGVLDVGAFSDTFAELAPRTSRGSRRAAYDLAIDNRGNASLNATLSAADPDRLLDFELSPPGVVADPGTAAFAKVEVKPKKSFWRGPPQTRPFRVQVESPGSPPIGVDGTLLQESILPPWFMRALLALLALLVLAVVFWLFFLRPAIESTARQRAEDVLVAAGFSVPPNIDDPQPTQAPGPTGGPGPGPTDAPGPTPAPAPGTSPGTGTPPPLAGGQPKSGRISVDGPALQVDPGTTLYLTDFVFSNPSDDSIGELQLVRDGQPLLVLRLENFRDLDFHFVTPIVVEGGQTLSLNCPDGCLGAAFSYSGYQR